MQICNLNNTGFYPSPVTRFVKVDFLSSSKASGIPAAMPEAHSSAQPD